MQPQPQPQPLLLSLRDVQLDTDQIRNWRSIVTLIVFVLTSKSQPPSARKSVAV